LSALLDWLVSHESALAAIAAMIAILAGVAVVARLIWTHMTNRVMNNLRRPEFLSGWRNIGLIIVVLLALLLIAIFTLGPDSAEQSDSDLSNTGLIATDLSATDLTTTDTAAVTPQTNITGKPSVAVLALNNISGDPEQTYLADGIAEDVITLLSRNPRFFVIARNSSFTYRGKAVDIRQVGEELGVRYVVEGSLRKIGERLRVNIQLIDTNNGRHVWAEKYDRAYANLFALQDEITNGIAIALGDQIYTAEIARADSTPTANLDAWGLVMRSNRAMNNFNRESSNQATQDLRAALALDPDYALAKAELALNLCLKVINNYSDKPKEDIARAYALGAEAVRAQPNHPIVLSKVGSCYGFTGRREDGIRLLGKALVKQANNAYALWPMGAALILDGQAALGQSKLEQAIQLSPQTPEMYIIKAFQVHALVELERYAEAEQAALTGLQTYDGWARSWINLARARASLGNTKGAQEALYKARELEPGFSLMSMKKSYAISFKDKGRGSLDLLEPIWPKDLLTADGTREQH